MRYLSEKDLTEKFSVSRQAIWKWRKKSGFPKSVYIAGINKPLWLESEVELWAVENSKRAA